ncbi:FkbM family methyltransferase [Mucilaginibacter sp.]
MAAFFKNYFKKKDNWMKFSYAQSGEDLIVKFIFDGLGIKKPSYIDIGAHHPFYLSNTALFYKGGSIGINIEPDPDLFKLFPLQRRHDVNLNLGIGAENGNADFYIISSPTLNTFSRDEAENYKKEGDYHIVKTLNIPVKHINDIIDQHCDGRFPNFLNIDAEGIDEVIVKSIDFANNFPTVICIETASFSSSGNSVKNYEIIDFLITNGYMIYADTYINTIFVKKDLWQRSK